MNKLLLPCTLATILLSQVSIGLASEIAHSSVLVNFLEPKNVKLVVYSTSTAGEALPPHSFTSCTQNGHAFMLGKGFPEGIAAMTWYIENATGSYEPIKSYDVFLKGGNAPSDPKLVEVDMSAYADYPSCTPDSSADPVMKMEIAR